MRKKYSKAIAFTLALGLLLTPVGNVMAANNSFESTETTTATMSGATSSNPLTEIDNLAVTPENLGIPGEERYGTGTYTTAYYARNIWDMTAIDGKVLLSMGDYGANTGEVPIYYYTNDSTEKKECTYKSWNNRAGLSSEEIKRLYNIDGTIYATSTDPQGSGNGSYYIFDSETDKWNDYYKLPLCVHCYDMIEYDGEIFFAGMVRDSKQHIVSCVQKLSKDDLGSDKYATSVKFYYADGTEMQADWVTSVDGDTEYKSFISNYWRSYDIFEFKGELYAAHSSGSSYTLTTTSGLFKYDKENNRFVQVYDGNAKKGFMSVTRNTTGIDYINNVKTDVHYSFEDNSQTLGVLTVGQEEIYGEIICGAKISTADTFVAVCNGIFKSSDAITFEQVSLGEGYENYVTRDAFEKDGKYYFLASVKNGTDDFTTAVFETDGKFKTFRRVLYFDTQSFARSFVYNEGYLYIGLGGNGRVDSLSGSVGSPYSGTLYRINLEELIPETPEKDTDKEDQKDEEKGDTETSDGTKEDQSDEGKEDTETSDGTKEDQSDEEKEDTETSDGTKEDQSDEEKGDTETPDDTADTPGKDGEEIETGWVKKDGKWYYLNADGSMKTGWMKENGTWYYLNANGSMHTGWLKDGNMWYYLSANGTMKTGWVKDGGKWYYLNGNGTMKTGWMQENGKWYYLNGSGDMAQGWIKVASKWYYLGTSGDMFTGWLKQNNIWYYLSSGGEMLSGWQQIKGKWYYFYTSGKMASNTKIGSYVVNANGEWVK